MSVRGVVRFVAEVPGAVVTLVRVGLAPGDVALAWLADEEER
ncbi:hypothetical protein [Prauserella endophytica]|nr:hypothetical protein [Prauserella endophytica]